MDSEFIKIKQTELAIQELNSLLGLVMKNEENFKKNPTLPLAKEIKKFTETTIEQFDKSINSIDQTLRQIEELILQKSSANTTDNQIFSKKEISHLLYNFFKSPIKTASYPLPSFTGCQASKRTNIQRGDFICVRVAPTEFRLMLAVQLNGSNLSCIAPDDSNDEPAVLELARSEWTPLPIVVPEKPSQRFEFARQANVLALIESNDGYIQTQFSPAIVISRPSDLQNTPNARNSNNETLYQVKTYDEVISFVPQKFVVIFNENWKKAYH